jgi:hypothetical protein
MTDRELKFLIVGLILGTPIGAIGLFVGLALLGLHAG